MIRKHLRSNVVGYVALFIALSGTAYAAGLKRNSVTSKAIKDGAVARADIAANAIDSSKVEDGSLTGADFGEPLPAGEQGPQGPQGPAGSPDTGAQILDKLGTVDGNGSLLDADFVDDYDSSSLVKVGDQAGGDLTGQYPNPDIAAGAIGPAESGAVPAVRVKSPYDNTCAAGPGILSDTLTRLRYAGERFDVGNLHSTETCDDYSKLVAPRDGIYLISASVVWGGNSAGSRFTGIRRNGDNDLFLAAMRTPGSGGGNPEQSVTTLARLSAGDYVEVLVSQNSGAFEYLDLGFERQSFQMIWMAPAP